MRKNEILLSTTFYYPKCKIKGCEGVLKFKRNADNFSIQYICDKNYLHNNENIKYADFMEYLKENNSEVCSKNCSIHNKLVSNYCNECKRYICDICLKICNNSNHPITSLNKYKLSDKQIKYLKKAFEEKKAYNKNLLLLIDSWEKELIQKISELKKNLDKEIELLEKIIINYNKNYYNLSYHKNINYLKDTLYHKNLILNDFYESESFREKTYHINQYLFKNYYNDYNEGNNCEGYIYEDNIYEDIIYEDNIHEDNIHEDNIHEDNIHEDNIHEDNIYEDYFFEKIKIQKNIGIIKAFHQLNNNYFFGIEADGSANIYNYNIEDGLNLRYKLKNWKFKGKYKGNSTLSSDKTQIFIHYRKNNGNIKIRILDIDFSNYTIKLSMDRFNVDELNVSGGYQIIELSKGIVVFLYDSTIKIFSKVNKKYEIVKTIKGDSEYGDLSLINNECFLTLDYNYIKFFNTKNFEMIKLIIIDKKRYFINSFPNKMHVFNDFVIMINFNYLILISIKTKEFVQIIELPKVIEQNLEDIFYFIDINNEIIHIYIRSYDDGYGCPCGSCREDPNLGNKYYFACLKFIDGALDFFDEKNKKIVSGKKAFKKLIFPKGKNYFESIYYIKEIGFLFKFDSGFKILKNY